MSKDNTDEFIDKLCENLKPCKPLPHPFLRAIPWLALSIVLTAAAVAVLGLRMDWQEKLQEPLFVFEITVMVAIAVFALLSSIWMSIPDMRGQKWLATVPLVLAIIFAIWTIIRGVTEGVEIPYIVFHNCMGDGMVIGVIPAIAMFFMTKQGATTRPVLMTISNALAVTAVAYIGLRFACLNDTIEHVGFTHILPYVILGIIAGFLARRLYRW